MGEADEASPKVTGGRHNPGEGGGSSFANAQRMLSAVPVGTSMGTVHRRLGFPHPAVPRLVLIEGGRHDAPAHETVMASRTADSSVAVGTAMLSVT